MFKIRRASDYGDENKPSENAEQRPVEYPNYDGGMNLIGTRTELQWFIRIDTLEELIALSKETGQDLVFDEDSIIIYDSYLE